MTLGPECVSRDQLGLVKERISGTEVSPRHVPPHSGHIRAGYPPGSVGGKASTMISSIQSAWSQERQRYLAHSLGGSQGISLSFSFNQSGWFFSFKRLLLAEEFVLCDDTIVGMIDGFQFHAVPATGTEQRILAEALAEEFGEGTSGNYAIAFRIRRRVGGENLGEVLPHLLIAGIAM